MRFGHLADVHIGCWRDPKMKQLSVDAFKAACNRVVDADVDFLLIAGDLFHTAIPSLDLVKAVVRTLQRVKQAGIPVYFIAGSHDYSPTGKTMLDVIEEAELGVNVTKGNVEEDDSLKLSFTEDPETGVKLTGVIGEAGMLDQQRYQDLDRDRLEREPGEKIFLFHTALEELKPDDLQMESSSVDFLPKGFDYYAGGHVHVVREHDYAKRGYDRVVYPGPLFPTSFDELEALGHGGFYLYDNGDVSREDVVLKDVVTVDVTADEDAPDEVEEKVLEAVSQEALEDSIVTVRVTGELVGGRTSDIGFDRIHDYVMDEDAFYVLKNTSGLQTESFTADVDEERGHEEIESELIDEYAGQVDHPFDDERAVIRGLLSSLSEEQQDGETNADYEDRMIDEAESILTTHIGREDQGGTGSDESLEAFIEED